MSHSPAKFLVEQNFSTRPYQSEAIIETTDFVKDLLK
jgi:hypothetical protein